MPTRANRRAPHHGRIALWLHWTPAHWRRRFCHHPVHGLAATMACPATCDSCPTTSDATVLMADADAAVDLEAVARALTRSPTQLPGVNLLDYGLDALLRGDEAPLEGVIVPLVEGDAPRARGVALDRGDESDKRR
eukprot:3433537-Prymnesium_polylepis.1